MGRAVINSSYNGAVPVDANQGSHPSCIPVWRMQKGHKEEALLRRKHQKKLEKKTSIRGMELVGGWDKEKMDGQEVPCAMWGGFDHSSIGFHPPRAALGALRERHSDIFGKLDHQVSTCKDLNPLLAGWGVPWLCLFWKTEMTTGLLLVQVVLKCLSQGYMRVIKPPTLACKNILRFQCWTLCAAQIILFSFGAGLPQFETNFVIYFSPPSIAINHM